VHQLQFEEVKSVHLNNAPKTALYLGCADARLAPNAPSELLHALGHQAGYKQTSPGGCNVLTEYSPSPTMSVEAARELSRVYALLTAAKGQVCEIVVANHTDCARDIIEGKAPRAQVDALAHSQAMVNRAVSFIAEDFAKQSVKERLVACGYNKLHIRGATLEIIMDSQPLTGRWHVSKPILIFS